jgi:hypothetical protein
VFVFAPGVEQGPAMVPPMMPDSIEAKIFTSQRLQLNEKRQSDAELTMSAAKLNIMLFFLCRPVPWAQRDVPKGLDIE